MGWAAMTLASVQKTAFQHSLEGDGSEECSIGLFQKARAAVRGSCKSVCVCVCVCVCGGGSVWGQGSCVWGSIN